MDKAKEALTPREGEAYGVYEHIFNMVTMALEKNPQNILQAVQKLPEFSKHVKGHRFDPERGVIRPPVATFDARDARRAQEERALFDKPQAKVVTEVSRPTPFTTVTTTTTEPVGLKTPYRPLAEDQRFHRISGVGLPKREYFLLDQAIAKLAHDKDLQDVQFFGKIFGTTANYIVACSRRYFEDPETKVYRERYEMPKPPRKGVDVPIQIEPPGIGLNRVTFWVCPYAGADWVALPDVTPQQINAARKVKKYFTGDLKAEVKSYPLFPGLEENYLRAQLARIASATEIAPEGQVEVYADEEEEPEDDEENPNALKEEKYKPLVTDAKAVPIEEGIEAFASTEKWQHTNLFIYKTGRGTMLPPAPEKDEEEEAQDEEEEENKEPEEEKKELLGPIKEDTRFAVIKIPQEPKEGEEGEGEEGGEDKEDEEAEGEDDGEDNPRRMVLQSWTGAATNNFYKKHGVVVIRSLRWPGATTWLSTGQVSGSIYLGDGLKSTDHAFSPPVPPPVLKEVPDMSEQPDPTSMTEKLVLRGEEPKAEDSEDEKEEEEEPAE